MTTVISGNEVRATINAWDDATAKPALVTVKNPAPGGGTSNVVDSCSEKCCVCGIRA